MIGIIGAMPVEIEGIRALLTESETERFGGAVFCRGNLHGSDGSTVEAVSAVCGVGKVNAALCAQAMILRYQPKLIINIGVGGGLLPDMRIGDIAVATAVVQHDFDTTPLGAPRGYLSNLDCVEIPCAKEVVDPLTRAGRNVEGVCLYIGTIATGDQFIHDLRIKVSLADHFGAIACEMEGAGVGQACALLGTPFGVIRTISDGANSRAATDFSAFLEQTAARSAALLAECAGALAE
ncbi:MAG: 5'-methylthioadenosine/adenosylhomocysteine nucleosidase [Oscillospiraceae bacterium]|jgi:adenosylhomocysteine nucleosidase|nr:5'-methylthioadenosine/adenosylhomocysteine nucleosidase [Oscillospiraceae bacterium]